MKLRKFLLPMAALLAVLLFVHNKSDFIGVPTEELENHVRAVRQIDEHWPCAASEPTGDMAALLFYSPERDDFSFSIHVNPSGCSFGWFGRGGGSILEVAEGIAVPPQWGAVRFCTDAGLWVEPVPWQL